MRTAGWSFAELSRATLIGHASQCARLLITIVLTPVIYRHFGADGYGLWIIVLSQVSLLGVLNFDLYGGVVRTVSEHRASGDLGQARTTLANALVLAVTVGLTAAIVLAVAGRHLLRLVGVGETDGVSLSALAGVAGTLFLCKQLAAVPEAALLSAKQYLPREILTVLSAVAGAVVVLAVVWFDRGLTALALGTAGIACCTTVATFAVARRLLPELPISLRNVGRQAADWRPICAFLGWSGLIGLAMALIYDVDTLLIGGLSGSGAVAAYALGLKIPTALWSVVQTTFRMVFPYAADLHGRGRLDRLRQTVRTGTMLAISLNLVFLIAAWFAGPRALELWVGPIADGTALLRIGLVVNVVFAAFLVAETTLTACGEVRAVAEIALISAVAALPIATALIVAYGAIGGILAMAATGLLMLTLTIRRVVRFLDVSMVAFVGNAIARPVVAALPAVALLVAVDRSFAGGATDVAAAGATVAAGLVFVSALVAFGLSAEERDFARRRAGTWVGWGATMWASRPGRSMQ